MCCRPYYFPHLSTEIVLKLEYFQKHGNQGPESQKWRHQVDNVFSLVDIRNVKYIHEWESYIQVSGHSISWRENGVVIGVRLGVTGMQRV